MSVALSLLASVLWGTADFLGGTAARRVRAVSVVGVSQATAVVAVVLVAGATGAFPAPTGYLPWALLGAVANLVALTAFYAALAAGTMGVVAPVAALGVVVPLTVGVASGDRPSAWQTAGVVVAVAGVVLACGPETGPGRARSARPLLLAAVAAVGFGTVIVCVSHGARTSVVMTLLVMRAGSVAVLGTAAAARRRAPDVTAEDLPLLAAVGVGDVGANAAFAVASTRGLLSVVAVLSSLYPAVTVLLARWVHAERLRPAQVVGVAGALTGVVLIASGGGVGG